ncbi:kinase-like domain-containing protein [Amanita rubescens]|nr:kinase-like domain-containing protein [Amanita rubescens]
MRFRNQLKTLVASIHSKPQAWPEENLSLATKDRGGYYSPSPRATLHARYTILRKLGWGRHSNVWLAKDSRTDEYVAVKILSAHATEVQGKVSCEGEILEKIQQQGSSSNHPGSSHVLGLRDHFNLTSNHGNHLCLVTDKIASQCLLALDFLHSECEVIHTDLKLDNIHISSLSVTEALMQEKSVPDTVDSQEPVVSRLIATITPDDAKNPGSNIQVKLTDFGTAAFFNGTHADMIQPVALRAPEVIIGCGWDQSADIWNLGCLVFELLTGRWLFNPRAGESYSPEAYHLAHMAPLVDSDFDPSVVRRGTKYNEYFFESGELRLRANGAKNIEAILGIYNIDESELPLCASFLRAMLQLNPVERERAKELLQHEWLKI